MYANLGYTFYLFVVIINIEVITMFDLADNKKIGEYIKRKIEEKGYNQSQFCKACLFEKDISIEDNSEHRNMCNRLSQIIKGNKGLQLTDLPVFSKLLDMSCEEILSAGKCVKPVSERFTNYYIATSKDEKEWISYVNMPDQLILNADEYGKTVIDYALEFENYGFLKFLMDNEYIWFVGDNEDYFCYGFGAGSRIERNTLFMQNMGVLDDRMKNQYDLRMKMIILAIKHGDIDMLDELHAREIPSLYYTLMSCTRMECEKYFDAGLIAALTNANDKVLSYFTKEIEITNGFGAMLKYIFPYTDRLISALIKAKSDYAERIIKVAIKHNQYVLDELTRLVAVDVEFCKEFYGEKIAFDKSKAEIIKKIVDYIDYNNDGNFVSYHTVENKSLLLSNIVRVTESTDKVNLKHLIQKLNEIYDKIINIQPII